MISKIPDNVGKVLRWKPIYVSYLSGLSLRHTWFLMGVVPDLAFLSLFCLLLRSCINVDFLPNAWRWLWSQQSISLDELLNIAALVSICLIYYGLVSQMLVGLPCQPFVLSLHVYICSSSAHYWCIFQAHNFVPMLTRAVVWILPLLWSPYGAVSQSSCAVWQAWHSMKTTLFWAQMVMHVYLWGVCLMS